VPFWRPRGCVLWLDFLEPEGDTAYDKSGYDNHGTIYGATRVRALGRYGLEFDGIDDFVKVQSDPSLPYESKPRTIELLMYITPDSWGFDVHTPFEYGVGALRRAFAIDMHTYPQMQFYSWGDDTYFNAGIPKECWAHIVATYDGDVTVKIWVNGILRVTHVLGAPLDTAETDINIGRSLLLGLYYLGKFTLIRIYTRVLSEREVRANYAYFFSRIKRAV